MGGASFVISVAEPSEILNKIKKYGVTVAQFVPTVLRYINETGQTPGLRGLRFLFSRGEAITTDLADNLVSQTQAELVNFTGRLRPPYNVAFTAIRSLTPYRAITSL